MLLIKYFINDAHLLKQCPFKEINVWKRIENCFHQNNSSETVKETILYSKLIFQNFHTQFFAVKENFLFRGYKWLTFKSWYVLYFRAYSIQRTNWAENMRSCLECERNSWKIITISTMYFDFQLWPCHKYEIRVIVMNSVYG